MSGLLARVPAARCYLDDVLVATGADHSEHVAALDAVAAAMASAGMTFKPSKTCLGFGELKYLGFIISRHGVRADPDMVEAAAAKHADSPPRTLKEVQRLVG